MAGMDRRDAEAAKPADEKLARVVRVDRAQLGLDRRRFLELVLVVRLIQIAREADDRVRVDEPGRYNFCLQPAPARRDRCLVFGTDALDFSVLDEDHAVSNRLPGHGVDDLSFDREILRECGERESCDDESKQGGLHRQFAPSATISEYMPRSFPAPRPPTARNRSAGSLRSNTRVPSTHVSRTCV